MAASRGRRTFDAAQQRTARDIEALAEPRKPRARISERATVAMSICLLENDLRW